MSSEDQSHQRCPRLSTVVAAPLYRYLLTRPVSEGNNILTATCGRTLRSSCRLEGLGGVDTLGLIVPHSRLDGSDASVITQAPLGVCNMFVLVLLVSATVLQGTDGLRDLRLAYG
jgi:hypothetical protein